MIKNNIILFLAVIGLCTSCKGQDVQIVVNDDYIDKIKVLHLSKNDTIVLSESKPNFYTLKNGFTQPILIAYKQKAFKISNIDKETKSIFIDYEENADNECYVVNKVYSDAVQSSDVSNLKECKAITNIYVYNQYNPDRDNKKPSVKLRPKN
ncbi:hypothetical protein [Ulvibacterium marinum]|uniref:hypothetical protein n=1 Tax=Ulvibacterium marinum TaxID=2419782 RepID=UPI0024943DB2|nr:hypothetical protein [Ulvibacterium marinum]